MRKPILVAIILILVLGMVPAATPTGACEPCEPHTPGYWKNHPEVWEGRVNSYELGILNSPVQGDKYVTMEKTFIATRLNILIGNCDDCSSEFYGVVDDVVTWLTTYQNQRPVAAKSSAWQEIEWANQLLDDFNNGRIACD